MTSCIIIEDDKLSQQALADRILEHHQNFRLIDVCSNAHDGIVAIRSHLPDLVFLDIELPGMSGFEMLKNVSDVDFEIIFTTAFNQYVIEAIRHSAMDYLLKPINPEELNNALIRFINKKLKKRNDNIEQLAQRLHSKNDKNKRIALPTFDGLTFVPIKEIMHCDSESNYTTLILSSGDKILVTRTLKEIEELINNKDFFRVHHSHLVNLSFVKKYVRGAGGYVVLLNGKSINVARNRKDDFFRALEMM